MKDGPGSDAAIYDALQHELIRYATALVGPDDAPDLVSGAVLGALRAKGSLSDLRDPKPYLMRSILNEARMLHRARSRRPVTALVSGSEPAISQEHDLTVDLVMGLPPRQRAATFLVYYQQYTPTEAAALMGCRAGTVRRYLSLARTKLQGALDE
jgi:RNA polymerase sigma factor (sigma-70 family)